MNYKANLTEALNKAPVHFRWILAIVSIADNTYSNRDIPSAAKDVFYRLDQLRKRVTFTPTFTEETYATIRGVINCLRKDLSEICSTMTPAHADLVSLSVKYAAEGVHQDVFYPYCLANILFSIKSFGKDLSTVLTAIYNHSTLLSVEDAGYSSSAFRYMLAAATRDYLQAIYYRLPGAYYEFVEPHSTTYVNLHRFKRFGRRLDYATNLDQWTILDYLMFIGEIRRAYVDLVDQDNNKMELLPASLYDIFTKGTVFAK